MSFSFCADLNFDFSDHRSRQNRALDTSQPSVRNIGKLLFTDCNNIKLVAKNIDCQAIRLTHEEQVSGKTSSVSIDRNSDSLAFGIYNLASSSTPYNVEITNSELKPIGFELEESDDAIVTEMFIKVEFKQLILKNIRIKPEWFSECNFGKIGSNNLFFDNVEVFSSSNFEREDFFDLLESQKNDGVNNLRASYSVEPKQKEEQRRRGIGEEAFSRRGTTFHLVPKPKET